MEQHTYRKWTLGLLLGLILVLVACAAFVWRVDPCFYYRMPADRKPVFFSERYQTAGIVRNNPADVVLIGSSMAANYRGSEIGEVFGGTGLRLTIPDGYFSEFDQVMGLLMRTHRPKRVIFAMDTNIFTRSPDGVTGAMPGYLYDANPVNDAKYLLADTAKNLAVVTRWAETYPDVEFDLFLSPYSILYWDKIGRTGETDAVFAALKLACETLLPYENITLHGLLFDREIIEQLDYYCDYVHHSAEAGELVLDKIRSGADLLTAENYQEILANWRDFVVNYDYDKFWDENYWIQFHTAAS